MGIMTGRELKAFRLKSQLTQEQAARRMGVSQTYLSLMESGKRPVSEGLKRKLVRTFSVSPTELPAKVKEYKVSKVSDDQLTSDLATLGYPGFSHWRHSRPKNPADVLLAGLYADQRDARLVEAFPWVVLQFPDLDWGSLVATAKLNDLQNRLGFVVSVSRGVADNAGDQTTAERLKSHEAELERSRLAREGTLCNDGMTNAERRWLAANRSTDAKHWRILADLSPQVVRYA